MINPNKWIASGNNIYYNTGSVETGNTVIIKSTGENISSYLYFATPYLGTGAHKCAIIAEGLTTWSRSKLHFCLNDVADNTYPTQNASISNSRMCITYDGYVGIGTPA
jgi:hypothetical protein